MEGVVSESRLEDCDRRFHASRLHVQPDEIRPLLRRRERGFTMGGHHRAPDEHGRSERLHIEALQRRPALPGGCLRGIPGLFGQMIGGHIVIDFRTG